MISTYIGIGSNLEQPLAQVQRAIRALDALPQSRLMAVSRLYRSAPLGPEGQPDYVNAAARLDTKLAAEELLDQLQAIERQHGRERSVRWGPRTLDLDILLFGDQQIQTQRLSVPHPELENRSFVLYPLADLDSALVIPPQRRLSDLLQGCPPTGLSVISETSGISGT